ncbi:MAG: hypothetical protein WDN00_05015 [Limisphaerales bacterium]
MNSKDICKDVFDLTIRLFGLYFLYIGLKDLDVPALMDLTIIKGDTLNDVFSAIVSALFNLVVAWWLLGSKSLVLRAYPATAKNLNQPHSSTEYMRIVSKPPQSPELKEMEAAEIKLATLVGKPKDCSVA